MRHTSSSRLVAVLVATILVIGACLFMVGCSNSPVGRQSERDTLTTGSISAPEPKAQPSKTATVLPGDTLYAIAHRNNVSAYDLMIWNDLSSTQIRVGQTLSVPPY